MIEKLLDIRINKVYSFTNNYTKEGYKGNRINRGNSALIIKYEGETCYLNNGKKIFSNKEQIVLLPKGCSYKWECVKKGHFLSIEFSSNLVGKDIMTIKYPYFEKIFKYYLSYSRDLITNYSAKEFIKIKYAYEVFYQIIEYLETNIYFEKKTKTIIYDVLEYINLNYGQKFTNESLASKTNYGVSHFRKVFKDVVGLSPLQYVNKVKMEKAKELLYGDFNKINDVADILGFENVYYFSNSFKKYYGLSPINYKKRL